MGEEVVPDMELNGVGDNGQSGSYLIPISDLD